MKKSIILGLDGASLDLIKRWGSEDQLPNFKKIMDRGVYGQLQTTVPPLTPCAWSSFMTGKNPGRHGIYDFFYLDDQHEMKIHSSKSRSAKDLWQYLSENDFKSFVFNVPCTYPPKKINGIIVSGFTTPSTATEFTHPAEVKSWIMEEYPDFKVAQASKYTEVPESQRGFREEAFALADVRLSVAMDLMAREDFDFNIVVFMLIDHMQHWYWKYMDPTHPKYQQNNDFQDTIKSAYKKMDVFLGKFMETFPDCNLILMSDHGGGPYYQDVAINNWLLDHKYLFLKKDRSFLKRIVNSIGLNKVIRRGLNMGLWRIIKAFPKTREFVRQKMALTYGDIDWANTLAYSYGYYGPIYINKSIITSKRRFQAIRDRIRVELRKIKDPISGGALVKNVWNKEELYAGEQVEILPDVIIDMGDYSYACSSTFPFSSGEMFSEPKTFKSGDHTQYGIFMAYGPDIKNGKEIKNATIYDITPTVLHMFNIPIPKDMDGTVLKDIFKANSVFTRAIKYESMKEDHGETGKAIGGQELVDTDEETVKEMLKGLGYL